MTEELSLESLPRAVALPPGPQTPILHLLLPMLSRLCSCPFWVLSLKTASSLSPAASYLSSGSPSSPQTGCGVKRREQGRTVPTFPSKVKGCPGGLEEDPPEEALAPGLLRSRLRLTRRCHSYILVNDSCFCKTVFELLYKYFK